MSSAEIVVSVIVVYRMQTLGADWLVASGHKMCGPTGIGFLWGRMSLLETMRPWQVRSNVANILHLCPVLSYVSPFSLLVATGKRSLSAACLSYPKKLFHLRL